VPQFLTLPAHRPDGKTAELVVNLDQVTRVAVSGPKDAIEAIQVFLSDGHHFNLTGKAAATFLDAIALPDHAVQHAADNPTTADPNLA
jgi:hypothetical protein